MAAISKIIGLMLLASVKYLFAVIPLLAGDSPWYIDMLTVAAGGTIGVFVFTYLGSLISKFFDKHQLFKIKYKSLKRFVRIKNNFGLIGIALISPMMISIPVGCIISANFDHDKKKIIRLQLFSVYLWSIVLFGLKGLFHINISDKL